MKPIVSAQVIGELRHRVIAHNEALPEDLRAEHRVKLNDLKKLYRQWYGGRDPHQHALALIDARLEQLHKQVLAKAAPPTERRDEDGRFTSGGQRGFYRDVASRSAHRQLEDENAGYEAAQTQVIPETRFSLFGPPIAGAAGVAYGVATGATADLHGNAPLDRASRHIAGKVGERAGALGGRVLAQPAADATRLTRAGIGAINRNLHTTLRRPGATRAADLEFHGERLGAKIGGAAGRASARVSTALTTGIPAGARWAGENLALHAGASPRVARWTGRGIGGLAGGLVAAGALQTFPYVGHLIPAFGPMASGVASHYGPYLDAAFPRHVRKQATALLEAPEVLAKQAELLDQPLNKADISEALRALGQLGGRAARAVRTRIPSIASHTTGPMAAAHTVAPPVGPAEQAAEGIFRTEQGRFHVGRQRAGRALAVGSHAAALGIGGAGIGALASVGGAAARNYFDPTEHPRDDHGRFTAKAARRNAAKTGAVVGGLVGLGAGLLTGLAAARGGHGALLTAALDRLNQARPDLEGRAMDQAREAHASAFVDANRQKIPQFAPGGPPNPQQVKAALEGHAVSRWQRTEGAALRGGAQRWYEYQLDEAFDRQAREQLRRIPDANGQRTPLVDKTGRAAQQNLINTLDTEKLNPGQKKLWDDLVQRREAARADIAEQFEKRRAAVEDLSARVTQLRERKTQIERDTDQVPDRLQEYENDPDAQLASIRRFAKDRLGLEVKGKTRKAALDEIRDALPAWQDRMDDQLKGVEQELADTQDTIKTARGQVIQDLSDAERMAIRNPFAGGRAQFFEKMPDPDVRKRAVEVAASRDFLRENNAAAHAARDYMKALAGAREAELRGRLPTQGFLGRQFHRAAPILAGRMHQALEDYAQITGANRASAKGVMKAVYDWLHAHRKPEQAYATAKVLAAHGYRHGKQTGTWALRNARTLSSVAGVAAALGAVDLAAPDGKKVRFNPAKWRLPKGLRVERDFPNPVHRPHDVLLGVSYRDRDNQQRFLHGVHIHGPKGEHRHIPFGVSVDQAKQQIRQGGGGGQGQQGQGGGPRAEAVEVKDPQALAETAKRLREANAVASVGPEGATFQARTGGNPGTAPKEFADAFYAKHLQPLERFMGQSTNQAPRYWASLKSLFEAPQAEVLSTEQKAQLLLGVGGHKRGIFANAAKVYTHPKAQGFDEQKARAELARQINVHTPTNADEYRQLKRALFTAADYLDFSPRTTTQLYDALDQAYTRSTGHEPPSATRHYTPGPGGDRARAAAFAEEALASTPEEERADEFKPDEDFKEAARTFYLSHLNRRREQMQRSSLRVDDDELHRQAAERARQYVQEIMRKSWEAQGLRKYLAWSASDDPTGVKRPWTPAKNPGSRGGQTTGGAGGSSGFASPIAGSRAAGLRAPKIQGAAMPSVPTTASAPTPSLGTRLHAGHLARQANNWGFGHVTYLAGRAAAQALFPHSGLAAAIGGGIGGLYGPGLTVGAANRAGAALSDTSQTDPYAPRSMAERIVRGAIPGTVVQPAVTAAYNKWRGYSKTETPELLAQAARRGIGRAANAFGQTAAGRVAADVAGRAADTTAGRAAAGAARGIGSAARGISSAAETVGEVPGKIAGAAGRAARAVAPGLFERLGSTVGGDVGAVGGAVAGTAAEPGGGTEVGELGGKLIGEGIGAGAGWLADEGIGLLWRHLGGYGAHVPQMAAQSLGLKPQVVPRAAPPSIRGRRPPAVATA